MRFLVDAQLPRRLAYWLRDRGHEVLHTLDLPLQNRTSDEVINQMSLAEKRVVITKDADFMNSHLLHKRPDKLLLVSTGNISNNDLLHLFEHNLGKIVEAFGEHTFVELTCNHLTIHR
jgi:predicted nuclease of predicted toxin-antitoxin system